MMDRRLAGLPAGPFGFEPRFYPPGQHPATHRMREQARILRECRDKMVANGVAQAVADSLVGPQLEHIDALLAAFEEKESEAKQRTLAMLERRS